MTPTVAGDLAHDVPPLTPDATCDRVRDAFTRDPGLFAVAVVDEAARPIGVVNRFKFLERLAGPFGRELTVNQPVQRLMDVAPLVLDVATSLDELGSRLVEQTALSVLDGFIVTREGRYAGIGTGLDLIRALTERRHAELQRLAHHDLLTGLPNRALFEQFLADAIRDAGADSGVAVMFVDLDRFKQINDTHGHRFGDQVLCAISSRMRLGVRKTDLVARLSGDEFAFVLRDVESPLDVETVARALLATCSAPLVVDGQDLSVSCSLGVALYPGDGATPEALLSAADTAQYHAKEIRNSWQRYTAEMVEWHVPILSASTLRQGFDNGDLGVHYQPIVELQNGRVVAVEALVRWTNPRKGAVSPADIVRIAEDSGLIVPLTEFVLDAALRDVQAWDRASGRVDLRLAINISAVQVQEGGLVAMIDQRLDATGFDSRRLELELTERAAMRASASTLAVLHALKARGITLTLDDFGTGYSALSRLERLPIDAMKIDKSFLERVSDRQRGGGAIARAIIAMGRALGVRIVAEGVENADELEFARGEGCDCAQGFALARPMAAAEILPLLVKQTVLTC